MSRLAAPSSAIPKVFLFDEPLSNLDAALRVSTRGEIAAIHRRLGATMIYVTHDQVEAMTMGTRICIMNGGRVAQVGQPLEVYRRPASTFVASFLGNPPMNLLPAVVTDKAGGRTLRVGESFLDLPAAISPALAAGRSITFGIRPEHIARTAGANKAATLEFEVEVQRIESLGAETIIVADVPGARRPLLARFTGEAQFTIGQRCQLHVDLDHARLFDENGAALQSG